MEYTHAHTFSLTLTLWHTITHAHTKSHTHAHTHLYVFAQLHPHNLSTNHVSEIYGGPGINEHLYAGFLVLVNSVCE